MKKFLNLIISAVLVLPTAIIFNDNQTKLISISNNNLNALAFNIENFQIKQEDLEGMFQEDLGVTKIVDLTAVNGLSSIEKLQKFYSKVELPDFYAGIGLFTRTVGKHSLTISTKGWKENWISKSITLAEGNETIGSAYIYGALKARLEIQKQLNLNHLLFKIHFYGSGIFESTATHPIGNLQTGWVMKLIPA